MYRCVGLQGLAGALRAVRYGGRGAAVGDSPVRREVIWPNPTTVTDAQVGRRRARKGAKPSIVIVAPVLGGPECVRALC